jgi:hypothetical protein
MNIQSDDEASSNLMLESPITEPGRFQARGSLAS